MAGSNDSFQNSFQKCGITSLNLVQKRTLFSGIDVNKLVPNSFNSGWLNSY